jgi:hypothetical protein
MDGVTLPSSLQNLTFDEDFNQKLEHVSLPSNLQNLTFVQDFKQSLERARLPSSLQSLTIGSDYCSVDLQSVNWPYSGGPVI